MAETRPFELDLNAPEHHTLPAYRRLGLLNGLFIGLALGLGFWGLEMIRVARLPLALALPTPALGVAIMTALGALVGWLSARLARNVVTVLLWAALGVLAVLAFGYLPFYGRSFVVWLADPRFFGRQVFPYTLGGTVSGLLLGGMFVILVLMVLGLLQDYRLRNLVNETRGPGLSSGRAWLALLLPVPIVFLIALATASVLTSPSATAAQLTHRAITRAQGFDGDVRDMPPEAGISYMALRPVQDQIDGPFTLGIADVNAATSIVTVAVHFDSGVWLHCDVINDQLNFCRDASLTFVTGLRNLITGEAPPENCRTCVVSASDEAAAWLAAHAAALGDDPAIERLAQWGNTVLMGVSGPDLAAQCWIEGISPAVVTACEER